MDTNGIKLTPKDIVSSLNEYIVGQEDANVKSQLRLEIDIAEACSLKKKSKRLHLKIF